MEGLPRGLNRDEATLSAVRKYSEKWDKDKGSWWALNTNYDSVQIRPWAPQALFTLCFGRLCSFPSFYITFDKPL